VYPWAGGCSASEEWPAWRAELDRFVSEHPFVRVDIVQRPNDLLKAARCRIEEELQQQRELAKESLKDADPGVQSLSGQLMNAICAQALSTVPEEMPFDGGELPSMASTAASILEARESAERVARDALERDNQAMNDLFSAQVRERLQRGEITADDVLTARATVAGAPNAARVASVRRDKRVCLVGLRNSAYNGATGVTDGISRGGRLQIRLDHPVVNTLPEINVTEEHVFDQESAEALISESSL
jgi:hypothetical protein